MLSAIYLDRYALFMDSEAEKVSANVLKLIFIMPTTNVLTAATLIYAIGAGITAAAGTRLALQSLLTTVFTDGPLQSSQWGVATFLHYLLLGDG